MNAEQALLQMLASLFAENVSLKNQVRDLAAKVKELEKPDEDEMS